VQYSTGRQIFCAVQRLETECLIHNRKTISPLIVVFAM